MKSPCYNCQDRGKEFCHHDDCPHGWAEYQKDVEKQRAENRAKVEANRRTVGFERMLKRGGKD